MEKLHDEGLSELHSSPNVVHKDTVERSRSEAGFKHSYESKLAIYDKSEAILQSLGPVQDQPIDLSLRGGLRKKKQTSSVYDCTVKDVEYICNILRY